MARHGRWHSRFRRKKPEYTATKDEAGYWTIYEGPRRLWFDEKRRVMKQLGLKDPEPKPRKKWVPPKRKLIVEMDPDDPSIPF